MTSAVAVAERRPFNPALAIALACVPVFVGALDLTVVSAVLPQVVYDLQLPLQSSLRDASWMVSGYLLAYTVAMTFMGRLSDLYGRRRVYLVSLAIFALGSFLVAVADQQPQLWMRRAYALVTGTRAPDNSLLALWALIGARAVQAFGGGAMVPVTMALVGDLYPAARRAGPLGVVGAVDTAGWVVGHLYGGILVRYFDWRTIFWLNLPICALAFGLVLWALWRVPQPRAPGGFDWPGALLVSGALIALSLGLGGGGDATAQSYGGSASPQIVPGLLAAAAALLAGFAWIETRQAYPLVPLRLFRERNFAAACAANFLTGFSLIVAIANVPLFINGLVATSLQQGAWDSGWMLSGLTVPMAIAALFGGWLTARAGYRRTAGPGLLGAIAGFALMSGWRPDTPYATMLAHLALGGVGFGLIISPVATAVLNAAGQARRGVAAALVIILRLCGMTIGAAAMTTYGLQRSDALLGPLAAGVTDTARLVEIGVRVLNQVINETFLIAAAVCALALVPALLLRADRPDPAMLENA